jgi:hypothetical protein
MYVQLYELITTYEQYQSGVNNKSIKDVVDRIEDFTNDEYFKNVVGKYNITKKFKRIFFSRISSILLEKQELKEVRNKISKLSI